MKTLQICPRHLSHVATLPWEIQRVIQKVKRSTFSGHRVQGEFWKSVKIWLNNGHEFGVQFLAHPVEAVLCINGCDCRLSPCNYQVIRVNVYQHMSFADFFNSVSWFFLVLKFFALMHWWYVRNSYWLHCIGILQSVWQFCLNCEKYHLYI